MFHSANIKESYESGRELEKYFKIDQLCQSPVVAVVYLANVFLPLLFRMATTIRDAAEGEMATEENSVKSMSSNRHHFRRIIVTIIRFIVVAHSSSSIPLKTNQIKGINGVGRIDSKRGASSSSDVCHVSSMQLD